MRIRIRSLFALAFLAFGAIFWFVRCSSAAGPSIPKVFYPIFPSVTVQCGSVGCVR
jgi:hypothetical protein